MIAAAITVCVFIATNEVVLAKCGYELRHRELYCANHANKCCSRPAARQ